MHTESAAAAFLPSEKILACVPLGNGHINATWKVKTDRGESYVLQQINQYVFREPVLLMDNVVAVTDHIRKKTDDPREAIAFCRTDSGAPYYLEETGAFWRMYRFVDGFCLEKPESEADFYQCARAFGRFQSLLADFPAGDLHETIPRFHDTADRYRLLREAIQADRAGRLQQVGAEADFFLTRQERACGLLALKEKGMLPLRVTHNDTKVNNVLLDKQTRHALCVLDLDTVMPGLSAYDFGDSIRSGAATAAEDSQDVAQMTLSLPLFAAYARGFLETAGSMTRAEVDALPLGAYAMTVECGVRFLTDYLDGDRYFKIDYPQHNLARARTQMALAADMERKWEKMQEIVAEVSQEIRKKRP